MRRPTPYAAAALLLATAALTLAPSTATGSGTGSSPSASPAEDAPARLVLLLDSSGSMAERAPGGGTKIAAAKEALREVVAQLPDDAEVGLRVFGAEVFSRGEPGACQDTQAVVPVGPLDRDALTDAVADYAPYGETPIGNALLGAAEDLGDEGERTIVLLSDGEPTCAPDPCAVARRLRADDVEVRVNVVGLDVSGAAREALRCTARAGGGTYVDAASADDLATSLVKVSVRDLRRFRLQGEPVTGGLTPADAVPLEPGAYVDSARGGEVRHYLVDRPAGGGVSVSVLSRPTREEGGTVITDVVSLSTLDGTECADALDQGFQVVGATPIVSTAVQFDAFTATASDDECDPAEQLVASVELDSRADFRVEVATTPPVVGGASLPPAVDDWDGPWHRAVRIPRGGATTPVAGGVTPQEAPALEPGTTYTDTLLASEQLVYEIPVEHGQAVRVAAELAPEAAADAALGIQGNPVDLVTLNALGASGQRVSDLDRGLRDQGFYNGAEPLVVTTALPPVRVRNAESTANALATHTRAGSVHVILGMGLLDSERADDFAVPVRLRVEVDGEPSGVPEYADAPASASPSPSAGETDEPADDPDAGAAADATEPVAADEGGAPLGLLVALGALLLAAVVAAVLLRLRRRRA